MIGRNYDDDYYYNSTDISMVVQFGWIETLFTEAYFIVGHYDNPTRISWIDLVLDLNWVLMIDIIAATALGN
jgi:hypothetical protein